MKQLKITLILMLSIAALGLCALMGLFLFHGSAVFSGSQQDYALVLEKEIDAQRIRSLQITMSFEDICFIQGSGDTIQIREYANYTPKSSQLPRVEDTGSELLIKGARVHFFSLVSLRSRIAYLEVSLPHRLFESLDSLQAQTASGDITAAFLLQPRERLSASTTSGDIILDTIAGNTHVSSTSGGIWVNQVAGDITASTTSGEIIIDSINGNTDISSTSGDITLGEVEGNLELSSTSGEIRLRAGHGSLLADTTSGDIILDRLDGDFRIDTTSGEVSIIDGNGYGQADTVSGDVYLALTALLGDLSISTTSGEVVLNLPETSSFTLDYDSNSGDCSTFFDDVLSFNQKGSQAKGTYGSGDHYLAVSTVSGDLWIQAK